MYDKAECQTGIVHIGYGNFHRAHQAMYIDRYMEETRDLRWGAVSWCCATSSMRNGMR